MAGSLFDAPQWHLERSNNLYSNWTDLQGHPVVGLPSQPPANISGGVLIYVTRNDTPVDDRNSDLYSTADLISTIYNWTLTPNTFVTMAERDIRPVFPGCTAPICSEQATCRKFYHCLDDVWIQTDKRFPNRVGDFQQQFRKCVDPLAKFRCAIWIIDLFNWYHDPCSYKTNVLSGYNWNQYQTSENIQTFIAGGQDTEILSWPGPSPGQSFSQALGSQMTNVIDSACSLERPCTIPLNCDLVGSWTSSMQGARVMPSVWGYFALTAVQNINHHLSNQYLAIKGALGLLALDGFTIGHFFPDPNTGLKLSDALTGLGTIFAIAGGFIPTVGEGFVAVGTALPAIGTFLSNAMQSQGVSNVGQELYSTKVKELYVNYIDTLSNMSTDLLTGKAIAGGYDIFQMMSNGSWANSSALPKLYSLETSLRLEILSRSINSLWKTPTSNKIWVLFVDLNDDRESKAKCLNDTSGPSDSKYCDDGGVYYMYNYIEVVAGEAYLGYPWGTQRLMPEHDIDPKWITEASAKTYQLAKQNGTVDPFNVSGTVGTDLFLRQFIGTNITTATLDQAGRYPGTWTLPVCNASTWGLDWNRNYNSSSFTGDRKRYSHPPCLCGDKGSETDAWARAAGMTNFATFHVRCTQALEKSTFKWPPGVTSVTYTSSPNYTVKKPGT